MSEAGNPLTDEQHRLFAEELKSIRAQLDAFRDGLVNRYGEDFDAAQSMAQAIATLGEVEQHMTTQLKADHPGIDEQVYGD